MKQHSQPRLVKDERDAQIDTRSRSAALDLTLICLVKGNPAWKGSLALLFIGAATALFYKYDQYKERLYIQVGVVLGIVGVALLVWFGFMG